MCVARSPRWTAARLEFSRAVVRRGRTPAGCFLDALSRQAALRHDREHERRGYRFSINVDGKTIDAWDDDRFATGGIGFIGAPDDRARLYWVRLTSTELTGKEQQTMSTMP